MKKSLLLCCLALGCVQTGWAQDLVNGWKFIKADVPPTADASGWETVSIPHT